MSYQKFETNHFLIGGRHQPATISIESDINEEGQNFLVCKCVQCNNKINDCW